MTIPETPRGGEARQGRRQDLDREPEARQGRRQDIPWHEAVALLRDADRVALACHVDPDGDALGSMLALHRVLRDLGIHTDSSWGAATAAGGLLVPPQYTFLPGVDELIPVRDFPAEPELLVALDTSTPERLGSLQAAAERARDVIVIDHHASGRAFGTVQLIDPDAPATAVLTDELIRRLGGKIDRDVATCLYVGLVTDTGRFQHAATTPDSLRLAARLMAEGIDHAGINRRVWETHSFGYLKVLARALERARLVPQVGLAWTAVTQADLDEVGIDLAETEGLIDVLRAVEAAECACVAKEQADGRWKVSLRSKGTIDVGSLAEELGGGGHAYAAGFGAEGTLDEAIAAVVRRLEDHSEALRSTGGSAR